MELCREAGNEVSTLMRCVAPMGVVSQTEQKISLAEFLQISLLTSFEHRTNGPCTRQSTKGCSRSPLSVGVWNLRNTLVCLFSTCCAGRGQGAHFYRMQAISCGLRSSVRYASGSGAGSVSGTRQAPGMPGNENPQSLPMQTGWLSGGCWLPRCSQH